MKLFSKIPPAWLEIMRNYLLNIMKEFHSNSELHVMAIIHFAIYMKENVLKNPKSL